MDREKDAVGGLVSRNGESGIGELSRADTGRTLRVRPKDLRRADRAVSRGLQMADEVVVFEWRRQQKDGIQRYAHLREPSPAVTE